MSPQPAGVKKILIKPTCYTDIENIFTLMLNTVILLYLTQVAPYDDAKAGAAAAVQSFGDF